MLAQSHIGLRARENADSRATMEGPVKLDAEEMAVYSITASSKHLVS
jgi:hypothetical protein